MSLTALSYYNQVNISSVITDTAWKEKTEGWKITALRTSALASVMILTAISLYANPIAGALILAGLPRGTTVFEEKVILPFKQVQKLAQFKNSLFCDIKSKLEQMETWNKAQYTIHLNSLLIDPNAIYHSKNHADLKPLLARALVWNERAQNLMRQMDELLANRDISENYLCMAKLATAYYLKLLSTPNAEYIPLEALGFSIHLSPEERVRLYDHADAGPGFLRNSDGKEFSKAYILSRCVSDIAFDIFGAGAVYHAPL